MGTKETGKKIAKRTKGNGAGELKPQKHAGGRPTKFEPELAERIISAIKAGGYVETAAAYAGVRKSTFYDWLRRGAREQQGEFKEFSDAVQRAIADSEMRYVAVVAKAAGGYDVVTERTVVNQTLDKDGKIVTLTNQTTERGHEFSPQAAEWWLERRFPRKWGRMERPEGSELQEEDGEKPLATLKRETIDIYDPDRLARLIGAFAEAGLVPEEIVGRFALPDPAKA